MIIHCSFCGTEGTSQERSLYETVHWPTQRGGVDYFWETAVAMLYTYSCEDDSGGYVTTIFCCPACFEKKLLPWAKAQDASVQEEGF